MLQPGNGSRLGVPNILLIITDGQSDHPPLSWTEAIEARRQGISVIAVSSRSVHTLHTALHTHSSQAHSLTQSVLVGPMPWRIASPRPLEGQIDIFERTTILLRPFNGLFSRTTWVSRYQKGTRSSAIAE